ncbi:MAG: hypothetical protein MUD10_00165 [Candidatus Pacebacteria bacterium]|jgi:uncharacterized membrane protein|nr:hypothetical protein [Candidatus Paceibacterota bacterium]
MNWVVESLLALMFFVLTQVLGKTTWRAGVPFSVINFATYAVAVLVFLVAGAATGIGTSAPGAYFLVVFAAVCIYAGNASSIRGFNRAPNPGYSTAIVKSYVVITLAASIFLFGGEFSWAKIAGVALILASQLLILANEKGKRKATGRHWAKYSFGAFFAYAALSITVKYATLAGINQLVFLFWSMLLSLSFFYAETMLRKINILDHKKQAGPLLLMGVASGFGNIFMWNAFTHAPNMGYVNAIHIANVAIISLLAVKLFGDELTRKKSLGIAGVTAGLIIIMI